jgi:hypothetical protein
MAITARVPYTKPKSIPTTVNKTERDLRYTLIPGEIKKNYCKIMINVRIHTGEGGFNLDYIKKLIMKYARKRQEHQFRSGIRPERVNLKEEEANTLISELIQQGYLKYYRTQPRDKLHPNIPEEGIKYYIFNKFKVIECEESKYFQQKQHKKIEQIETKGKLSDRRCRALRQIYAQYTDKVPFTYEMLRKLPQMYSKMAETMDKNSRDWKTTKYLLTAAAKYTESANDDFLDTWNSLIRNNYIVPYKVRAKDGKIKIVRGVYKVNMEYVRSCLSTINL